MRAAEAGEPSLRLGSVTGLLRRGEDAVGVDLEDDAVVIAMVAWSVLAAQWLPLPPVLGLNGHSLVFDTGAATGGLWLRPCLDEWGPSAAPSFLVDGAVFSPEWKEALWARFFTAAPQRQRQSVARYSIVKRA